MDAIGLPVLAVGALLCYAGARSVHIALLASGFALGWLITESFNASFLTDLVVGLAVAAATWVLAHLIFKVALFCIGGMAGAVIGAKIFGLLQPGERSVLLVVLFVAAAAFIGGLVTQRFQRAALVALCALSGAALVLSGLARTFPHALGFFLDPVQVWQAVVDGLAWLTLAVSGFVVQRGTVGAKTPERVA